MNERVHVFIIINVLREHKKHVQIFKRSRHKLNGEIVSIEVELFTICGLW